MQERLRVFEEKLRERAAIHKEMHWAKRLLWAAGGFLVLGAGLAMLVLPGPGLLVIAIGLGILALEFAWAEWLLHRGISSGIKIGSLITLRRLIVFLFIAGAIVAIALIILL